MNNLIRSDSVLGGNQNIVGSKDKDLVLQTKGKVKIQQGNSFLDLIKDGKLNTPKIIRIVKTVDDIGESTGFYYVEADGAIYAVADKSLIPLGNAELTVHDSKNGVDKLSELSDVLLVNLRDGDLLTYKGGYWVNSLLNINDLEELISGNLSELRTALKKQSEYTQRTWQDVQETFNMMFDPEGNYFTEKITPLAVHTAQLIVGTNSQQFNIENIKFSPNYLGDENRFAAFVIDTTKPGTLVHNTIGLGNDSDTIGMTWEILQNTGSLTNPDFDQTDLDPDKSYYLYAKCSKVTNQGELYLSTEQKLLESDSGYYNFWIGVLNIPRASLAAGGTTPDSTVKNSMVRSFQAMFGFTEIAGNQITTGVIKDQIGFSYWDMINGNMRIGDPSGSYIEFDSDTKQLLIKGYIVQADPDNQPISFVGNFTHSSEVEYLKNQVVIYEGNLYICTASTNGGLTPPDNTSCWSLYMPSTGYEIRYKLSTVETPPSTPTGDGPSGWSKDILEVNETYKYLYVTNRTRESNGLWGSWSTPSLFNKYVETLFKAELDNEVDSIACNDDMTAYDNQTVTTKVYAYVGTKAATITKLEVSVSTFTYSSSISNGVGTINFNITKGTSVARNTVATITVTSTYDGQTYISTRKFTINAIPGGASAIIYRLVVSPDVVKISSAGVASPSSVTCSATKTIGGTTSSYTGSIKYSYDGSSTEYSATTPKTINASGFTKYVKIDLIVNGLVVDSETVPKVLDAVNSFKSTVFKRDASQPATPTGGSYTSPVPSGWSDGVPDGTAILWASTRTFSEDSSKSDAAWTTPKQMTNTADFDVYFSSVASSPGNPTSNPSNWSTTASSASIWMATRTITNGINGTWQISKIKGENGLDSYTYTVEPKSLNLGLSNGSITPSSHTFYCYKNGNNGRTSETAIWKYYVSNDNSSWTLNSSYSSYTSSYTFTFNSSYKYHKIVANTGNVTCEAYATVVQDGAQGEIGPSIVFRGQYNSSTEYHGTTALREIVYTGTSTKTYYYSKTTAGTFSGYTPSSTSSKWQQFGSSFSSVATDLLFANVAYIGGFNFNNNRIWSSGSNNNIYLNGAAGTSASALVFGVGSGLITSSPSGADGTGSINSNNASFAVFGDGSMKATNATISGYITATGGKIGQFLLSGNGLVSTTGGYIQITRQSDGDLFLAPGDYYYNKSGSKLAISAYGKTLRSLTLYSQEIIIEPATIGSSYTISNCPSVLNIKCSSYRDSNYGGNFSIGFCHISGDSANVRRTVIKAPWLVAYNHVNNAFSSSRSWYKVIYDENSGCFATIGLNANP